MKAAVITFPGSNCDRDLRVALRDAGAEVAQVWHKDDALPAGTDLVAVPGGFSFGDYLRCGAIAAQSPIAKAIRAHAARGGFVLGVCNGFQVLTELGLLPGALMRNAGLTFIAKPVALEVTSTDSAFTSGYRAGQILQIPVAHHDYAPAINGSVADIAGVLSENRRVLGMMPHPERAIDPAHGGTDGKAMFAGLASALLAA